MTQKYYYISYQERETGRVTDSTVNIHAVRVVKARNEGDAIMEIIDEKGYKMIHVSSIVKITYTQYLGFEDWIARAKEHRAKAKEEEPEQIVMKMLDK